ncbi:MAG: hypothetical protein JWR69_3631 [Pedosphaera sp.]|nr:hypothetical protein [Pedosphaera sp.]
MLLAVQLSKPSWRLVAFIMEHSMRLKAYITALLVCVAFHNHPETVCAQSSGFTYQGRLTDNGSPATGRYDLTFALFTGSNSVSQVGATLTKSAVGVTNGLFATTLDFGGAFPGADRWLELSVRTNGGGAYVILTPRQQLSPTPYAITASNLSGTLPAAQLSGTLPGGLISGTYGGAVNMNNAANSFAGNGGGLTNVNAKTVGGLSASNFWQLGGNAGTTAGVNFLGTTDDQPLEFRVNGQRALRLELNPGGPANFFAGDNEGGIFGSTGHVGLTIGGGGSNFVAPDFGTIAGGSGNEVASDSEYGFIGGGTVNTIGSISKYATIGGGSNNFVHDGYGFIGGGELNFVDWGDHAVISGGSSNRIGVWPYGPPSGATVGGGVGNAILCGAVGTIGGGSGNKVGTNLTYLVPLDGSAGTIAGGGSNIVTGVYGSVPGGLRNVATNYAFAAGRRANAVHDGTFVWADSADANFSSTGSNQFLIRASGGVGIGKTNPATALDVNGTITASGLLRSGSETGTSEAPSPAGLVIRRINSTNNSINQIVARSDVLTLERDGSFGGFIIRYPANPGHQTIACMGINNSGTAVNFYTALNNPGAAGTIAIYGNAQGLVHFECSFGNTFNASHLTQVILSRFTNDSFWAGNVTSTVNQ